MINRRRASFLRIAAVAALGCIGLGSLGCPTDPVSSTAPKVTSVYPTTVLARGGAQVVVVGEDFADSPNVKLQGREAALASALDRKALVVTAPAGDIGAADVTVTNPDGAVGTLAAAITYVEGDVAVSQVVPSELDVTGGRAVVLGAGFVPGMTVAIGNTPLSADAVDVLSDDAVVITVPPAVPTGDGTADVTVTLPSGGQATLLDALRFVDLVGESTDALTLAQVLPPRGAATGGTRVAIVGTGFRADVAFTLGGLDAVVESRSSRVAIVLTPPGSGVVALSAEQEGEGRRTLQDAFTYVDGEVPTAVLALTRVTPATGDVDGSTIVALTGAALDTAVRVTFGGAEAPILERVSAALLLVRPPPRGAGTVDVSVADATTAVSLVGAYTYAVPGVDPVNPVRDFVAVEPRVGAATGGTRIAINGLGLTGVTGVTIRGAAAVGVTVLGDTMVTCTTPSGAVGPADVALTLDDGVVLTRPRAFYYFDLASTLPPPIVESITPASGPLAGGSPFVLRGRRFAQVVDVAIDGRPATGVLRVNDTITARAPVGVRAGAVDVAVAHSDGQASFLVGGFTYFVPGATAPPPPTITTLQPAVASSLGGTVISVTGTGFAAGAIVLVDGLPGRDVAVPAATRLDFRAPARSPGVARLTIVNPDGQFAERAAAISYEATGPSMASIFPTVGPEVGGTGVSVRGAGFDPGATVAFGGTAATQVVVLSDTLLLAMTPSSIPRTVDVRVTNPGNLSATLPGAFAYTPGAFAADPPILAAIEPATGPTNGGTRVLLSGQGFADGGLLLFGEQEVRSATVIDETTITATVPAGASGVVDVVWFNPDGQVSVRRGGFTYADPLVAPPTIAGLTPNSAPEAGGTPVIVAGTNFTAGSNVFFGNVPGTDVVVFNAAFLSVRAPSHPPGPVNISVTTTEGLTATLPAGFTFVASPEVVAVAPALGPVGAASDVQLAGRNFQAGAQVFVADLAASNVVVLSSSLLTARLPPLSAGARTVRVRNPDGQEAVLVDGFEYVDAPVLDQVFPATVPTTGGTRAIFEGVGFRAGLLITVDGAPATDVVIVSDTLATAVVPAHAVGVVAARVQNADGQEGTLAAALTYVEPGVVGTPPSIAACFPNTGPTAGQAGVRITGSGFRAGDVAFFGGVPAVSTSLGSPTELSTRTPARAAGIVAVEVTAAAGATGRRAGCYTFSDQLSNQPPPLIGNVSPGAGPTSGGATVVVTGDHFQAGALLLVGSRLASSIVVVNPTRIEAITPPGEVGLVDVLVTNPDGNLFTSPGAYRYLAPPIVSFVSPADGASVGGTAVTVVGSGFQPGLQLRFANLLATDIVVDNENTIRARTPSAAPGAAEIAVFNPDGQVGVLSAGFFFNGPPRINAVAPTEGTTLGGTLVDITGSSFRTGARVFFGTNESTEVTVFSATSIRARTPARAAGPVAVRVVNPDNFEDTLSLAYLYTSPPSITSVGPTSGPQDGGTTVTILGRDFVEGCTVNFSGTPAASVRFDSSTVLTVTTPARAAGQTTVAVVNPDGQPGILVNGFFFFPPVPPPRIESVTPNFGAVTGGSQATVVGAEFQFGAQVFVGGRLVVDQQTTVISSTLIRIVVPAGDVADVVDVRVVNPDQQDDVLEGGFSYFPIQGLPGLALVSISPNRTTINGGTSATIIGNGFAPDATFVLTRNGVEVLVPIETRFGFAGVGVVLPGVAEEGIYNLVVRVPSAGTEVTLANAVTYSGFDASFVERRGRLENDRGSRGDESAAIFDIDGDGFKDVFITRQQFRPRVLRNRGALQPAFFDNVTDATLLNAPSASQDNTDTGQFSMNSPLAADFTSDGLTDVLVRNDRACNFRVMRNLGGGRLDFNGPALNPDTAHCADYSDWAIGDIDNSNGLDVLLCRNGGRHRILRNRGIVRDGSGAPVLDGEGLVQWRGFESIDFIANVSGTNLAPAESTRGCDLGDVDGSGTLDVVFGNSGNQPNRLYLNTLVDVTQQTFAATATNIGVEGSTKIVQQNAVFLSDSRVGFMTLDARATGSYRFTFTAFSDLVSGVGALMRVTVDNVEVGVFQVDNVNTNVGTFVTDAIALGVGNHVVRFNMTNNASGRNLYVRQILVNQPSVKEPRFLDVSESARFRTSKDTRSARFMDVDHDGDSDVLFGNLNQDAVIMLNDGAGASFTFAERINLICHEPTCQNSLSTPSLVRSVTSISGTADLRSALGGDPVRTVGDLNAADRYLDINEDGCRDLAVTFTGDRQDQPRFYLQLAGGPPPTGCTGTFVFNSVAPDAFGSPIRDLNRGGFTSSEEQGLVRVSEGFHTMSDLDNDGDLDMYLVQADRQDRILLRDDLVVGNETLRPFIHRTYDGVMPNDNGLCERVIAADVDGDGDQDLVIANHAPAGVTRFNAAFPDARQRSRSRLWLNDGTGAFLDASDNFPLPQVDARAVVAADFDGDGDLDVIVASSDNFSDVRVELLHFLQNTGGGVFVDRTSATGLGGIGRANTLLAVDMDGDGDLDLVVGGEDGRTGGVGDGDSCGFSGGHRLFINGGDALGRGVPFFFNQTSAVGAFCGVRSVAVVDYNSDGAPDIFYGTSGQNRLFEQRLDGSGRPTLTFTEVTAPVPVRSDNTMTVLVGAWSGSPRTDLLIVNDTQMRMNVSQDQSQSFTFSDVTAATVFDNSITCCDRAYAVDFDRDTRLDFILPKNREYYINVGAPLFRKQADLFPTTVVNTSDFAIADFDNDGDQDIFVCDFGNQGRFWENTEF